MYEELIAQLKPCPKFNLAWYQNEDLYSEGEVEDTIIRLIAENEPEDYVQAIADHFCWSVYYHLTHTRKNLLNWYPFSPEASVLEIGCGMGAVTGTLCDKAKEVTAVELSYRRAVGTLLRCREKENLEIIVGNLNDITFEKKFDYITLIGVLEYQGSYTDTENPYLDFLKKVKTLLKPNGRLLIAIENQYGLKYWCGAKEDHTGLPFEGMNQYTISSKKVRTFSRSGLQKLIMQSGFSHTFFYYPMPDYKLPAVVYSEACLPKNENMLNMQYYYVPDDTTLVAQEKDIYRDVIDNGVFGFFANSFMVECSDSEELGEITFASMSSRRFPEYQVGTKFTKSGEAAKFALAGENGRKHLEETWENERKLEQRGLHVWESRLREGELISGYAEAKTLEEILLEVYRNGNQADIYALWEQILTEILLSSEEVSWEDNILYTFGLDIVPDKERYGAILRTGYLDMIPRNAFWEEGTIYWFDQEWTLENVPARFVLYRALLRFYCAYEVANQTLPLSELARSFGLAAGWKDYQQLESLFFGVVTDAVHMAESDAFCGDTRKACLESIARITGK